MLNGLQHEMVLSLRFSFFYFEQNKANVIQCGSEWARYTKIFNLPFMRTKWKSIRANDRMKLLLAVSVCAFTSAYINNNIQHIKEWNGKLWTHMQFFPVFLCIRIKCIHELDRPSSFSCWIKAKSLARKHKLYTH